MCLFYANLSLLFSLTSELSTQNYTVSLTKDKIIYSNELEVRTYDATCLRCNDSGCVEKVSIHDQLAEVMNHFLLGVTWEIEIYFNTFVCYLSYNAIEVLRGYYVGAHVSHDMPAYRR